MSLHVHYNLSRHHSGADLMMSSKKLELVREQQSICEEQFIELAKLAGISKELEDAFSAHTPLNWDSDAPSSSEQGHREDAEYWVHQHSTTARLLRKAIFSVSDIGMRRSLIAKVVEEEGLRREWFALLAHDAKTNLKKFRIAKPTWFIFASIIGATSVAVGYHFFGTPGAIGGAVVGFFIGQYFVQVSKAEHDNRTRLAEGDMREANASKTEILNRPGTFSRREVKSGEPDIDSGAIA